MNCSILTVGTELLMGQIVNSNAAFLSRELNELGINVLYHLSVGDNPERLEDILNNALEFSDIIITTGGLGPTQDDLTKEVISKCASRDLVFNEDVLSEIKDYFIKINKEMTSNNYKQAYLPANSKLLNNSMGTAPGFIIDDIDKIIISLPGPPQEMQHMFYSHVKEYLSNKTGYIIKSKIIKFFGIGESELEAKLCDLITHQTNPTLATYANNGVLSLRITAKAKSEEIIDSLINPLINEITLRLNRNIYSYNNESLEEVVARELINRNITISLAESCTGGILSSKLTAIPGISKVLDRSIVTYSNRAKTEELGVGQEILEKYGAVSQETATAMVKGLKKVTESDVCISITGIAGPDGGTDEKPVGLVYIAALYKESIMCEKYNFIGSRSKIRNYASNYALNIIHNILKNNI